MIKEFSPSCRREFLDHQPDVGEAGAAGGRPRTAPAPDRLGRPARPAATPPSRRGCGCSSSTGGSRWTPCCPPSATSPTALGTSRTTAAAAYELLRETGFAASRQGSGTWTTLPGGRPDAPRCRGPCGAGAGTAAGAVDLATRGARGAAPAARGLRRGAGRAAPLPARARATTTAACPRCGSGWPPASPRAGCRRRPDQILITSGALQAVRLACRGDVGAGDRVLVEQPGYPRRAGRRPPSRRPRGPVPVERAAGAAPTPGAGTPSGRPAPRAAYLIPDFQNPTGAVLPDGPTRGSGRPGPGRAPAARGRRRDARRADWRSGAGPDAGPVRRVRPAASRWSRVGLGEQDLLGRPAGRLAAGRTRLTIRRLAALRARLRPRPARSWSSSPALTCWTQLGRDAGRAPVRLRAAAAAALRRRARASTCRSGGSPVPAGGQVLWCELPAPASRRARRGGGGPRACGSRRGRGSRRTARSRRGIRLPFTRPGERAAGVAVGCSAQAWAARPCVRGRARRRRRRVSRAGTPVGAAAAV